jgi:hypothetical protein
MQFHFSNLAHFRSLLESDAGMELTPSREQMDVLNYQLCDLTQLYNFAKRFNLHEVKIAVLHCAGKYDQEIMQNVWKELLQKGNYFSFCR